MKDSVQASKNKFSLSWNYPYVTCSGSSDALAAGKSQNPVLYPGFVAFFSFT